jgi:hypothetical protein
LDVTDKEIQEGETIPKDRLKYAIDKFKIFIENYKDDDNQEIINILDILAVKLGEVDENINCVSKNKVKVKIEELMQKIEDNHNFKRYWKFWDYMRTCITNIFIEDNSSQDYREQILTNIRNLSKNFSLYDKSESSFVRDEFDDIEKEYDNGEKKETTNILVENQDIQQYILNIDKVLTPPEAENTEARNEWTKIVNNFYTSNFDKFVYTFSLLEQKYGIKLLPDRNS